MKGGQPISTPMPPEVREQVAQKPPEVRAAIAQVWTLLGHLDRDALEVPDTPAAWEAVQQRLDTAPSAAKETRTRRPLRRERRRSVRRLSLVLVGLVVLWLGGGLWSRPVLVAVPEGGQQRVTLPDGSTVQLNSASQMTYRRGFQVAPFVPARVRSVRLEGEAFFEVTRSQQPFIVETFNAQVEVLGTQFNVRARQGPWEGGTRVTLASGRVQVSAANDPANAMLLGHPGQTVYVDEAPPKRLPVQPDSVQRAFSWRQQGFAAIDQPLASILAEVERRYNVSIDVETGIALTDSINAFYPRGTTAEQILHDICLSEHCRYRAISTGFVVFPADSIQGNQEESPGF